VDATEKELRELEDELEDELETLEEELSELEDELVITGIELLLESETEGLTDDVIIAFAVDGVDIDEELG
jgi:hypothetical protein